MMETTKLRGKGARENTVKVVFEETEERGKPAKKGPIIFLMQLLRGMVDKHLERGTTP